MKKLSAIVIMMSGLMTVTACPEESEPADGSQGAKGVVDVDALETGVEVALTGNTGRVIVPLATPIPQGSDEELQEACARAVSVRVASEGDSVELGTHGEVVEGMPTSAGEYSWIINSTRDEATLTFYNEANGLSLTAGNEYEGTLTIAVNDYIERLRTTTFPVDVK